MPEEPEDVLPQDGIAASSSVVEVRAVETVDLKLDQGDSKDRQCEDNED